MTGGEPGGPWASLGLRNVINAAGKMTYLGSSAIGPEVSAAMVHAAGRHVDMAGLQAAVSRRLAELAGAPAACVVSCAAAGIVQCVAGAITGTDPTLIEAVPDSLPGRRDVILQAGHAVNFGAPLTQMLRLAGARVRTIDPASRKDVDQFTAAIGPNSAAVVYVVSHHTIGGRELDLPTVVSHAHEAGIPVIVDAAAEIDLSRYLAVGADAAVYSGHKAIAGPTSGLVLGRPELVAACAAQQAGIGRAMKIGKEGLVGLLAAVERHVAGLTTRSETELLDVLATIQTNLNGAIPADLEIRTDATRPIPRLQLAMRPTSSLDASELVRRLEAHDPSIRTRNHAADAGTIEIDPRELLPQDALILADVMRDIFAAADDGTGP